MRFPVLREAAESLFAVLFPSDCLLCRQELGESVASRVCPRCWRQIQPWQGPVCGRCGLPMASIRAEESAATLCGNCHNEEPGFDGARSYALYMGLLRTLILEMKFRGHKRLGRPLGRRLVELWPWVAGNALGQSPVLVPVPLHPSRRRERGFNQAEQIAAGLLEAVLETTGESRPGVELHALLRIRRTPPQTGLSLAARRENVRGAFSVAEPERVRGRTIVLIDDVMTTGETVRSCARVLRAAGAERVLALTVARATPQFPDTGEPRGSAEFLAVEE